MELTQAYRNYIKHVNFQLDHYGVLNVKLMNTSNESFIPTKKYPSDAGYDCRARLDETLVIEPGKRASVPLGFAINIPMHYTGDLRPRSGLTKDNGIIIGYGTIDAGYTGEVQATVFNFGEVDFVIEPGDRIAQLVILPIAMPTFTNRGVEMKVTDNLFELDRGEKGHGSSGVK